MQTQIYDWLVTHQVNTYPEVIAILGVMAIWLVCGVLTYYVSHLVIRHAIQSVCADSKFLFVRRLSETRFFAYVSYLVVALVLGHLAQVWFEPSVVQKALITAIQIWGLFCVLLIVFAFLNTVTRWGFERDLVGNFPLRGLIQTLKLLLSVGIGIISISLLIGQSPIILLSGLGAMTAVLMLIFKDPILGLVAGIQLSANHMLSVGDWLEMRKYNADGAVIDIGLTTVKVRNWDNTVTTIPTYALISDSFKNWRPMSESGGRRIKRAIFIDVTTVRFIEENEVKRLIRSPLLADYIIAKSHELDDANKNADMSLVLNGRRLTNLGTFRAYLERYLKNHPKVNQNMSVMVRQLAPSAEGLPLEIYCFSNDVAWVNYEGIQADIFDHILAVIGEFGLRMHQTPTGYDMQVGLGQKSA